MRLRGLVNLWKFGGDKIIMELNDSAKNGDVETAWDSSEVGANAEIEYVPLMRVENSSSPSQQHNTATLCGWDHDAFKKFAICWFVVFTVVDFAGGGGGMGILGGFFLFPVGLLIAIPLRFCWVTWTNYLGYDICENFAVTIKNFTLTIKKKCSDFSDGIFETLRKMKFFKGYENF